MAASKEISLDELKILLVKEIKNIAQKINSAVPEKIKVLIHNEYIIIEVERFFSPGALLVAQSSEGRDLLRAFYEILKEKLLRSVPFVKTMEEMGIYINNVFLDVDPEADTGLAILLLSQAPWLA